MATAASDIRWDGTTYPYMPGKTLDVDGSVAFHTETAETDPIVHEVLRHAIWNVNMEHGNAIIRTSGSPICAYGHDFNPVILDEEGGYVSFGKFNQYLATASGLAVKWTLENRSANPGINPGDIFLTNDPWIGATHQPDVTLVAPVFVDDQIFCWVGNTLHQWDVGGTVPGGFNPIAENVYWEAPCIPPVKVVEAGRMRKDIEEHYTRQSRLPHLVALDLRAMVTGCNIARDRILRLVERYGAATLKGTMRKLQDDSEAAFVRRLESIPDGTWTQEGWVETKLPGDRGVYRDMVTLTKKGDRLIFSNAGTAPQDGSLSAGFASIRGGVVAMLTSMMLFDQMFVIEGAIRRCEFVMEPGTITCPVHPASVAGGTAATLLITMGLTGVAISKMLSTSTDEELRTEVASCMGVMGFPINAISGVDQHGNAYASFLNEPVGAALAASNWRDGVDTGGWPWDLQSTMPNVEDNELFYPLLYLWRKELPDSGGAGKFRGGNGSESGIITHKADRVDWATIAAEVALPGPGLFGGLPPGTNNYELLKDAKPLEQLARTGRMPTTTEELGGERDIVPAKSFDRWTTKDDVWIFAWAGAGGYGDPLERDPEAVLADVAAGRVSHSWATEVYGVVVEGEGDHATLDASATEHRRAAIVQERLSEGRLWTGGEDAATNGSATPADGRLTEYVDVRDGRLVCGDIDLGPASGNYKLGALVRDRPLSAANPTLRDPAIYTDNAITFREFICPQTGRLLDTEIVVDGEDPQWDVQPGRLVAPLA
jgi:N-methylhydantoinase B